MSTRSKLTTTVAIATLAGVCTATAFAAPGSEDRRPGPRAELALLERPTERLERSIELHQGRVERLRERRAERREARRPDFASPESLGVSQPTLDAIASCESGGDPAAVSSEGTYRGKYQFDSGTWASVGGSGDPAAASAAEQDMRAAMLYSQAGSSPWPLCGV